MVEWARGGYERTFNQSAANGIKEPRIKDAAPSRYVWFLGLLERNRNF